VKKFIAIALIALCAGSLRTYPEVNQNLAQSKTRNDKASSRPHLVSGCSSGFQLAVVVPVSGQAISVPIYVGTDAAAYRISPLSETTIYAQNLQVIMVLNGDSTNTVTIDAFTSSTPANSLDVQAKRIDLKIDHPPGGLSGSTATFCILRLPS
jgi:hypothetical protein